ncbi:K(+)-transporting ATPase subunit F [Streptomyces sp. NPDC005438]
MSAVSVENVLGLVVALALAVYLLLALVRPDTL